MRKNFLIAMFFPFLVMVIVACTKTVSLSDSSIEQAIPSSIDKARALQIMNEVRKKGCQCGDKWYGPAPALTWNNVLEKIASEHSVEMNRKNELSHESSGKGPGERIREAGYNWILYGENVALGFHDEKTVIEGWLKSPGHCKNIMNPAFREVGMARSGNYWTQDFGTK